MSYLSSALAWNDDRIDGKLKVEEAVLLLGPFFNFYRKRDNPVYPFPVREIMFAVSKKSVRYVDPRNTVALDFMLLWRHSKTP
jgi:hypothetical protein